jgi:hypothetical protein
MGVKRDIIRSISFAATELTANAAPTLITLIARIALTTPRGRNRGVQGVFETR